MKQVLWYLTAGTRGGETRVLIISSIKQTPKNANKLSTSLKLDYKTIQHHLKILVDNRIFTVVNKGGYGAVYFISPEMEEIMDVFDEIKDKFGSNLGKH